MQNAKRLMPWSVVSFIAVVAVILFTGCQASKNSRSDTTSAQMTVAPAATAAPVATPAPAATAALVPVPPPVRIKAGLFTAFTDSDGHVWLPDQGFANGDTTDRPDDMQIANTKDPALYRTERYGMTSFSYPVPNGKYTVKLHFAETFDGISGPGGRVFSFNVGGREFKDFDIWVKAGGQQRAYIETVNVEVTNGKLDISFTSNVENPEINGIEILPAP
ncbi:MAG: malectin [Limisphaerales bacterium]